LGFVIFVLGEELAFLVRGEARLDDDVILEIKDALEVLQRHVQHQADAAGQRLEEPDMGDGAGELDMAHAVTAHLLHRDFHAALLADDALVLHALVLAAQALIVLHRTEDAGAEKPVPLRFEGAVIDGFRLFDLAMAPAQDLIRRGQGDFDAVEGGDFLGRTEDIHQLLIHLRAFLSNDKTGFEQSRAARVYGAGPLTSSTLSDRERISLTSTLKLSGIPASNVSSPR